MQNRFIGSGLIVGAFVFVPRCAFPHHSDAGVYAEVPVTLEAVVVEMRLINPHTLIVVDVVGADRQIVQWQVETGSVAQLARRGWHKDTLKPGDRITVTGLPARNGTPMLGDVSITMTRSGEEILTRRSQTAATK
jgi:Family of unknown function (DUF6152)